MINKEKMSEFLKRTGILAVSAALVTSALFLTGCQKEVKPTDTTEETKEDTQTIAENTDAVTAGEMRIIAGVDGDGGVTAGETFTVKIRLENVTELSSLAFAASWDDELILTDAEYGSEFNGMKHTPEKVEGEEYYASPVAFNWLALEDANAVKTDCTFLTLTFKAGSKAGTYHLNLSADPDNVFDSKDNNVPFSVTNAEIVVSAAE